MNTAKKAMQHEKLSTTFLSLLSCMVHYLKQRKKFCGFYFDTFRLIFNPENKLLFVLDADKKAVAKKCAVLL